MTIASKRFYIITGGTFSDVAPHLSLAARAFGSVGRELGAALQWQLQARRIENTSVHLIRTRMALGEQHPSQEEITALAGAGVADLVTDRDVAKLVAHLTAQPETRGIVMSAAIVDFEAASFLGHGGVDAVRAPARERPRFSSDADITIRFRPVGKILPTIRRDRKDIFLVGFKTTAGSTPAAQYERALKSLKQSSANLVFANDVQTGHHMVVTPEQARYHEGSNRRAAVAGLAEMIALRSQGHFTRATVVPGEPVSWVDDAVPHALRIAVNHCIDRGAYKRFLGATVGHFAVRQPDGSILTSRRKTDFNELGRVGMVRIETLDADRVIAHGSKPSVGGQSQRRIFTDHPDVDCIVHAHCPLKPGSTVPVVPQRPYECGSHECGENTSRGMKAFGPIRAVMLDNHGFNVAYPKSLDPTEVIRFLDANFDLAASTDGRA